MADAGDRAVHDRRTYEANRTIYRVGESADFVYVVQQGSVNLIDETGSRPPVGVGQNDLFGEYEILTGQDRTLLASAGPKGAVCLLVPASKFRSDLARSPKFIQALTRLLAIRAWEGSAPAPQPGAPADEPAGEATGDG